MTSHPIDVKKFSLKNPVTVGTTSTGQSIKLGAFSGLQFLGRTSEGKLLFLTHTDRGPNAEAYLENDRTNRPFLFPDFQPRLVYLIVDPSHEDIEVTEQITLKITQAQAFSGLPHNDQHEQPVDAKGIKLPFDEQGIDVEGIQKLQDGSYWLAEEYGPSLLHVAADGVLIKRYSPGDGLPLALQQCILNRGFEGLAFVDDSLFVMLQSALDNPASQLNTSGKQSKNIRIIQFDLQSKEVKGQYVYRLQEHGSDRIGDITAIDRHHFLVVEQNNEPDEPSFKKIYLIDLSKATNIHNFPEALVGLNGKLEAMNAQTLKEAGISPVQKSEIFNLNDIGIVYEKVEGITIVDSEHIAIITDNDFGLSGALDRRTGRASIKEELSTIYVLPYRFNEFADWSKN